MAHAQPNPVLRYVRRVAGAAGAGNITDAELLARFIANRDEAAFELLLWRHGTMVLHVCRDVTRDEHAAEDAFQATFLTLVRKAASIRSRESLGAWLYQVAYRVALRARRGSREAVCMDFAAIPAPARNVVVIASRYAATTASCWAGGNLAICSTPCSSRDGTSPDASGGEIGFVKPNDWPNEKKRHRHHAQYFHDLHFPRRATQEVARFQVLNQAS